MSEKTAVALRPTEEMKRILGSQSIQDQFKNALGEQSNLFVASIIDIYANDATLQKYDPGIVVREALKAATLRLPINKNLGFAYIIPYKGVPTMSVGYKGYVQLAQRTGQYRYINSGAVYEGELVKADKLTGALDLSGERKSDKVVGFFAYIETVAGFKKAMYWTTEQIEKHRDRHSPSKGSDYSPWRTSFESMAIKTVLKSLLSKYGIMSIELIAAIDGDVDTKVENDVYTDVTVLPNQGNVVDFEGDVDDSDPEQPTEGAETSNPTPPKRGRATKTQPQPADREELNMGGEETSAESPGF